MVPAFYTLILVATLWLAVLATCARLQVRGCTRLVNVGLGLATVLLLFLPVGGLRLWNWAFSFCPNPSLPLLGMVCAGLGQRLFGIEVLKPADWRATWIFGLVAGSALYLHPMLVGSLDLYYWGWERARAGWFLAALAVVFLAGGNRHGVLLLAALIAYALDALESGNCWDYVIDPFYWMTGVVVMGTRGVAWCLARRRDQSAGRALPPPAAEAVLVPKPSG
ncbi:MAG: hypothetical protein EXS37_02810 [Opitutus sp.]|nr:hypothetical protein [Opitutus sp.]